MPRWRSLVMTMRVTRSSSPCGSQIQSSDQQWHSQQTQEVCWVPAVPEAMLPASAESAPSAGVAQDERSRPAMASDPWLRHGKRLKDLLEIHFRQVRHLPQDLTNVALRAHLLLSDLRCLQISNVGSQRRDQAGAPEGILLALLPVGHDSRYAARRKGVHAVHEDGQGPEQVV